MQAQRRRGVPRGALLAGLALALAATGTATATSLIGGADVRDGSLTGADVRDGSIGRADLAPGARQARARRGPRGPRGPRGFRGYDGPVGPAGPSGPSGPAGIASVTAVDGPAAFQCADGGGACQVASSVAGCPAGMVAIGGGFAASGVDDVVSYARRGPYSYGVIATNFDSTSATVAAQVICASGPGLATTRSASGAGAPFDRDMAARLQQARAGVLAGR